MFLVSSNIPYSLYSLMVDRLSVIDDSYSYRPDRLVDAYYGQDFFTEALCNEASNVSAISMESGTEYLLPSQLFMKNFGGV